MKFDPIIFVIGDPKAPKRLRGGTVTFTLDDVNHKLNVDCDIPDDPTPNELGYLRLRVGEMIEELRERFPGMIGEGQESVIRKE